MERVVNQSGLVGGVEHGPGCMGGCLLEKLEVARMLPIGPGGLQSGFSTLRYVRRDFRKKKIGSADSPRPAPRWPPVACGYVHQVPSSSNWNLGT
jgi:hypothetical protein